MSCLHHIQEWEYEFGKMMPDKDGHLRLIEWSQVCDWDEYDNCGGEIVWKPMNPQYEYWVLVICVWLSLRCKFCESSSIFFFVFCRCLQALSAKLPRASREVGPNNNLVTTHFMRIK